MTIIFRIKTNGIPQTKQKLIFTRFMNILFLRFKKELAKYNSHWNWYHHYIIGKKCLFWLSFFLIINNRLGPRIFSQFPRYLDWLDPTMRVAASSICPSRCRRRACEQFDLCENHQWAQLVATLYHPSRSICQKLIFFKPKSWIFLFLWFDQKSRNRQKNKWQIYGRTVLGKIVLNY